MLEGRVVLPRLHMRCYRFNYLENGGRIPRMVLSASALKVGVASPLHPFLQDVYEAYHLAPIQINPNSCRSMIALYIIYYKQGFPFLDANTLGYFIQLKKSSKKDFGYVYFSVWPEFNGKNLVFGAPSNAGSWKEWFFYIHDVPRVKTSFNYNPGKEANPLFSCSYCTSFHYSNKYLDLIAAPTRTVLRGSLKRTPTVSWVCRATKGI